MTTVWRPLDTELQRWRDDGLTLPVWWRDDDAISATPQLERLTALSCDLQLPVHVAIIPRDAENGLVQFMAENSSLIPVVHGWTHQNHAPDGEKKAEFRLHRPLPIVLEDAQAGIGRLNDLFADNLCRMFVPPWNRISPEVSAHLPDLGFRILSTATPRKSKLAAPGLQQINTHLDPIDWRGTRGLVSPDLLVARMVALLQDRREGRADNTEPFGVLTHHLVHDQDIWTFTRNLLRILLDGPSTVWSASKELNDHGDAE